jgi:hypothetical protein
MTSETTIAATLRAMLDDTRCELCERPTDGVACRRCGAVVCRMHFDGQLRFCAECAERAKPTGRRGDTFLL